MTSKLHLTIDLPNVAPEDLNRVAAQLLRDAAERVAQGHAFGGFNYGREGSFDGSFMLGDFKWSSVGQSRPEPAELDQTNRELLKEYAPDLPPAEFEKAFAILRPNAVRAA